MSSLQLYSTDTYMNLCAHHCAWWPIMGLVAQDLGMWLRSSALPSQHARVRLSRSGVFIVNGWLKSRIRTFVILKYYSASWKITNLNLRYLETLEKPGTWIFDILKYYGTSWEIKNLNLWYLEILLGNQELEPLRSWDIMVQLWQSRTWICGISRNFNLWYLEIFNTNWLYILENQELESLISWNLMVHLGKSRTWIHHFPLPKS